MTKENFSFMNILMHFFCNSWELYFYFYFLNLQMVVWLCYMTASLEIQYQDRINVLQIPTCWGTP